MSGGTWQSRTVGAVLAVVALVLVLGAVLFWGPGGTERMVDISAGAGAAVIAQRLRAAGVVRSAWAFRLAAALSGQARRLQAGEYAFAPRSDLFRVVRRLAQGDTVRHAFTIPEGFTAAQIAEKLAAEGLADREVFLAAARDPALAKDLGVSAAGLEGFLFPDTYQFPKGLTVEQMVRHMVGRFRQVADPKLAAAARAEGLDDLQWVTLASIIEREVRVDAERPKVASVFYNRLRQDRRLESCATVLYSQGRTSGELTTADLFTRSPYNTYRHRGLPPGPICNPGRLSLEAAAHPARTDHLFFVVRPDGEHVFSTDFEAHKRAKWAQRRVRERGPVPGTPTP